MRHLALLRDWFLRPESPVPLAWFRISIALFCLIRLLLVLPWFLDLYGQYGLVQWAITRANLSTQLPHLGNLSLFLQRFGLTADQTVWFFAGLFVVVLLGLLAGYQTRLMAILAWFINFLWMFAGGGLTYGMDIFAHIALFYLMIMPSGDAHSIDARIRKVPPVPSVAAGVTRHMLQLHVCIIYTSSGIEKAAGIQWWNGDAIWRSVMLPTFQQFDMSWLARAPIIPMVLGWMTLTTEIGYGFFIWSPRTRLIWLSMAIGMHLFIGMFLGMWLFGWIMILLNLGAFGFGVRTATQSGRRFRSNVEASSSELQTDATARPATTED